MSERLSRRDFLKIGPTTFLAAIGLIATPKLFDSDHESTQEQQKFLVDHGIHKGNTSIPSVLMTYDDWPNKPEQLAQILDAYKGRGKTTFFILGDRLNYLADGKLKDYGWPNTDLIKRIVDEGHEIGCHGWQHEIPMTQLKDSTLSQQFEQWLEALHKILPNQETLFFRAPFGAHDQRVRKIAAKFGLQHVMWGVESGGLTDQTYNNVIKGIIQQGYGSIVLSHMQRSYDVSEADKIVSSILQSGQSLNTIAIGISPADKLP